MSAKILKIRNPLQHNGVSQSERLAMALIPENLKLDERTTKDLLVAAHRYAALLCYYDEGNKTDGDWTCFWEVEPLTFLAILAETDTDVLLKSYNDLEIALAESIIEGKDPEKTAPPGPEGGANLLDLIEFIFQTASRIEQALQILPPDLNIYREILALVRIDRTGDQENLETALIRLIRYHKNAHYELYKENLPPNTYLPFFGKHWGIADRAAYDQLKADGTFDREVLRALFRQFYQTILKVKYRANYWFDKMIAEPRLHQPHVALFLTFLRLFEHSRNSLNTLTGKHLNFYYERVLCTERRGEIPDEAFIIFELAKGVDELLIEKDTALLAGKDANGRPLIFQTIEDWVVNTVQIKEIKNTYFNLSGAFPKEIYAAPDAKDPDQHCWRPLGDHPELPTADLGFAVASPQLLLQEGHRKLQVNWTWRGPLAVFQKLDLELRLSTEAGLIPFVEQQKDPAALYHFKLQQDLAICISEMESARRLVGDLTADSARYTDGAKENADIAAIYARSGTSIPILNNSVFFPAYQKLNQIEAILLQVTDPGSSALQAELYGLHGYFYWTLAQVFAPAYDADQLDTLTALPKQWPVAEGAELEYFTLAELYENIEKNLRQAESIWRKTGFNNTMPNTQLGLHGILLLLSRLALARQDWTTAQILCDEIISSGRYALSADISSIFTEPHNSEIIWLSGSCRSKDPELSDFAQYNWLDRDGNISDQRSVSADSKIDALYDNGEGPEDQRFPAFFVVIDDDDPIFPDVTVAIWGQKYYRQPEGKTVLLRYAEVLLNAAMASIKLGNLLWGNELINLIRARADRSLLSPFTNTAEAITELLQERFREFIFEGDRRESLRYAQLDIPGGDRNTGPIPWNDPSLYFTPPDLSDAAPEEPDTLLTVNSTVSLELAEDFPPLVHFADDSSLSKNTKWPYLKFLLKESAPAPTYSLLRDTTIQDVRIKVDVSGISEKLVVQNDFGLYDGTQRFVPFGTTPQVGAQFYLGSAEVFQKKVDQLAVHLEWVDPPLISDRYGNYLAEDYNAFDPSLQIDVLSRSKFRAADFQPITYGSAPLGADLTVHGRVTEPHGKPLTGVNVTVPGTNSGTITDTNGNYSIQVPAGDYRLFFTFDTYQTLEVAVNDTSEINIILTPAEPGPYAAFDLVENDRLVSNFLLKEILQRRDPTFQAIRKYQPTTSRGFIRLSLKGSDFLHEAYNRAITLHAIRVGKPGITEDQVLAQPIPKAPYLPAINSIRVDYVSDQLLFKDVSSPVDEWHYLLPFEGSRKLDYQATIGAPVVDPYYEPGYVRPNTAHWAQANLYLGLENLTPGQNLALLVQAVDGSEPDPCFQPADIIWSYLAQDNRWIRFTTDKILRDTTFGLTRTGMIQLATSRDMVRENSLFNQELYWIRASASNDNTVAPAKSIRALPCLADIRTQALIARFDNRNNDLAHLAAPLPERTISKLLVSNAAVKKIEQPFSSFNGKLPENGNEYYRRISERLRHRDRAIQIWDYERLLLEQYPGVLRAKCLNHTNLISELAPGYVTVAVVPDQRKRKAVLRAEPRFSFGDLLEMEAFLRTKTNLFVAWEKVKPQVICKPPVLEDEEKYLRVVNPEYEPLRLYIEVQFREGVDAEFHRFRLDNELKTFLAPWLTDEAADIIFGTQLFVSRILEFIETRAYVDAIADLQVFHALESPALLALDHLFAFDQGAALDQAQLDDLLAVQDCLVAHDRIIPTTSRSILTTYTNEKKAPNQTDHVILVREKGEWCAGLSKKQKLIQSITKK